jgi:hypothetical protein
MAYPLYRLRWLGWPLKSFNAESLPPFFARLPVTGKTPRHYRP